MTAVNGTELDASPPVSGAALEVDDLHVGFPTDDGLVLAVRGVTFTLHPGEALGIVGESGSGKSVTSMAVMGLLPKTAQVAGSARVLGQEVIGLNDAQISEVRGKRIAMIFQDPLTSLNPVYTVGYQIAEAILAHHRVTKQEARARAVELLDTVGIPHPEQRVDSYPHEMSGGMRQRVVIAIAMANEPDVIIADEPTTALDVTVQAQVLEALQTARSRTGAALVLITHDLGVVAGQVDRVAVMYAGRIVETGEVTEVFQHARMPYTIGLLGSLPRMDEQRHERLTPILGTPPSMVDLPPGCSFAPRCPMATDLCLEEDPPLFPSAEAAHAAACHYSDQLADTTPRDLFRATAVDTEGLTESEEGESGKSVASKEERIATAETSRSVVEDTREPVLTARGLVKHFPVRSRGLIRRRIGETHAVCDVSLDLRPRETLALVGESGCGKSTTARLLVNLLKPTLGSVVHKGQELGTLTTARMRPLRRNLQIVFQDPFASLDPRMPVHDIIAEPLQVHRRYERGGRQVEDLLEVVGLSPEHGNRYPHEFSGGQRQRIGIARALALDPEVIVLDEPVSALDVSIQAGVINLLEELQERLGLAYLFVSHDLSVVRHTAHRVAVMYLGRVVEQATNEQLFAAPAHPYTQALMSAIPLPDPVKERRRERVRITGDVPNPVDPPSGCRFRTRCPKFAGELNDAQRDRCVTEIPTLTNRALEPGHIAACHYAEPRALI
ncbi:ABC transporter ATP-binding protein [Spiractinospora alimapuensis]|uniref:ABC transporter ATP-binding protein n=1 Tax=Spiractinospora alimapuensis TaxID=2820884 RepID=UPI001F203F94|nr:ABC transporter ATP-binding protein [Spiractinospora alimapuensis]QVQ50160.1 ABC transporter ATP-binding protein [Spiractinospora alimapuensis]